jgi:anaphase-promoting complex subunit 3
LSKEQNYCEAIKYFKRASQINPKSVILCNYLALAHQNNKQLKHALQTFEESEKIDVNNPMTKYQKANVLVALKDYNSALKILLDLNETMPKEAPINILIGKIYKFQKNFSKAFHYFNLALEIDPKDSNMAKAEIEKLYNNDDLKGEN